MASLFPTSPSPSSLRQTPSTNAKSIEHVWNDIKLSSLSNCSLDLNLNNPTSLAADSSFLKRHTPPTFLSAPNPSFDANCDPNINKMVQRDIYDKRHKRMIKNRESAAYRKELEIKIARLTEENSRLRKQLEELQIRVAMPPRMGTLYRTSTSPF
ncbi:protein FD-like [Abrus precatorius]|uniref:Protein FD-like n=1 Tax=Abrus precatorius TaxID=3816 RepID=A0A8B8LNL7_ABRPR|nr:protein FD-like [Abrus precatorius]